MSLPNVVIELGNGNLGQVAATTDGVAGIILTGTAVADKLEYNKHYLLGSTAGLEVLGVTKENNPLIEKEVAAFYAEAGEGAELHLVVVSEATTLESMCDTVQSSVIHTLVDGAQGRIRLLGVNKIAPGAYTPDLTQGIDKDAILAAAKAHSVAESYTADVKPFRVLMPAPAWKPDAASLFKPSESSYNRVAFVLSADKAVGGKYPASIGAALGRAAKIEVQQSLGRVKNGSVCPEGYFTDGKKMQEHYSEMNSLHDAGYIFFRDYPGKSGCYFNGDPMAVSPTDDYSSLHLGRVIDKAIMLIYSTYVSEIMDNILVDDKGQLPVGVCKSYEAMIENAVLSAMGNQISSFTPEVKAEQNVLSTKRLGISCKIVPQGVLDGIDVKLSLSNPQL